MSGSSWTDRRVLVTGASGIIGSWLCRRLNRDGAHVTAFLREADPQSDLVRSGTLAEISLAMGSLEDYRAVERAVNEHEIEVVFHLGAQTIVGAANRSPLPTLLANVLGTAHVMEATRVHAGLVRAVVVASTDKAYGEQTVLPYVEDMPLVGRHPYDVSKSCTDLISTAYAHTYETPTAVVRAGNVYGGGDLNWSRLVPGTIRALLHDRRPVLRSDGTYVRDYVYVEDVVDAYLCVAENVLEGSAVGESFNVGARQPMTVLEMYDAVCRAVGEEGVEPRILGAATGEIRDQYLDATKIRERLGWQPKHDLEHGLERTVDWYRTFFR